MSLEQYYWPNRTQYFVISEQYLLLINRFTSEEQELSNYEESFGSLTL